LLLQCLWENAHKNIEEALTKLDDDVGILLPQPGVISQVVNRVGSVLNIVKKITKLKRTEFRKKRGK
jgi:hypothetical protein